MKKIFILIISIFVCIGCSSKKKEPVKLVLDWTINTNHTGIYVAQKLGYYKDLGLDIEIVAPPEDGSLSLVAANKAEYGISFQEVLAPSLAQEEALPVSAIAAIVNHNRSGLVSLKNKGITSPKNLENKKLASWGTEMFDSIVGNIVRKDGGDYNKVHKIQTDVMDPLAALNSEIDAIWVYHSWDLLRLLKENIQVNYIDIPTENKVFDYYSPIIVVNNDYAKKNKKAVEDFLFATSKGYNYAINNPKKSADILLEYAPELDKKMVYASQNFLAKEYKSDAKYWGEIDLERWNNFYKWLYDNKIVAQSIEDKGLNTSFIENIKK